MKVKYKDLADDKKLISHLVCEGLNKEAQATMPPRGQKDPETTEAEITVLFNGVPLDVENFFNAMERQFDQILDRRAEINANKKFELFKNEYKSKNSNNAKLEKIKVQVEKANLQLNMIYHSIQLLNHDINTEA